MKKKKKQAPFGYAKMQKSEMSSTNRYSLRHFSQYHTLMDFAIFSDILMQSPWNHSLQLSQPLYDKRVNHKIVHYEHHNNYLTSY